MDGFDLTGRRVLVTGASTGIGAATAARLASAGAHVVAVSRSGRAPSAEGRIEPLVADLGVVDDLDGVVDRAVGVLGGLDVLVNNAGAAEWRAVDDIDRDYFDDLVGLNLWAPLRLCQLAHPHLVASDAATVINIGSVDATRPSPGAAVYGATKAGLGALTVVLAKEWASDGIRVVQIDPGLVNTPLASDAVARVEAENARINLTGRVGDPDEVAGLVHYLVSPLGGFVNGVSLRLDGGALAMGPFDAVDDPPRSD